MRYIWGHLRAFFLADFSPWRYSLAAAWMALMMAVNYTFDVEDAILDPLEGTWDGWMLYGLLYAAAYVPLIVPAVVFRPRLGLAVALGLLILTTDASATWYRDLARSYQGGAQFQFVWMVAQQLQSLLTVLLPLALLYPWLRPMEGFYGLSLSNRVKLTPYLLMLGVMVVPIALAATTEGFQAAYPTWQRVFAWPAEWRKVLPYEAAYVWDFLATELLFRGFFVVALARLGGPQIVLAATSMYCALHFGKPLGECISSVFGGYLLSALAYRTGNIWGGVIVHIGIALLMDVFAVAVRMV